MLSCRGKFKLFQGIQWINSIKVTSSSIRSNWAVLVIEEFQLGEALACDDTSIIAARSDSRGEDLIFS